jgi:hypothetical protein
LLSRPLTTLAGSNVQSLIAIRIPLSENIQ